MDCDSEAKELRLEKAGLRIEARVAAAAGLLLVCFGVLYRNVAAELVSDWIRDDNNSHGFLILPLSLYFVWERRRRLLEAQARPAWGGMLLAAAGVVLTVLDMHPFVNRMAMLLALAGILLGLLGRERLRVLAFPLLFLLLMIPIPAIILNQVAFPLQLVASKFGEWTLASCRVPVLREGNVIHLANTSLEVAEACSGIRSLVSLLTLGIVYGYFMESRLWVRVVLALATAPVAIVANAARVAGTGLAAHYYGEQASQGFFHAFSGWVVFIVAFAMIFAIHRVIRFAAPQRR